MSQLKYSSRQQGVTDNLSDQKLCVQSCFFNAEFWFVVGVTRSLYTWQTLLEYNQQTEM